MDWDRLLGCATLSAAVVVLRPDGLYADGDGSAGPRGLARHEAEGLVANGSGRVRRRQGISRQGFQFTDLLRQYVESALPESL